MTALKKPEKTELVKTKMSCAILTIFYHLFFKKGKASNILGIKKAIYKFCLLTIKFKIYLCLSNDMKRLFHFLILLK